MNRYVTRFCRAAVLPILIVFLCTHATLAQQWENQSPYPTDTHLLAIDFVTPSMGWIGGGFSGNAEILKTTDGGVTWEQQLFDNLETIHDIDMFDENVGIAVGSLNVYRTSNGGQTWSSSPIPQGVGGTQVQMVSTTHGFLSTRPAGTTNYLYRTTNGGSSWQYVGDFWVGEWKFLDQNFGWAVDTNNEFVRTNDGGQTWSVVPMPAANVGGEIAKVISYDESIVSTFTVADRFYVHHTTDGGQSWQSSMSDAGGRYQRFVDSTFGWGFNQGIIHHSNDGGVNWTQQHQVGLTIRDLEPVSSTQAYAVGDWGYIIGTTDGGQTWFQISNGTGRELKSISMADPFHGWAVGSNGAILRTIDGGKFWTIQETNLPFPFFCPEATNVWAKTADYAIVQCGYGFMATYDGGETWVDLAGAWPTGILNFLDETSAAVITPGGQNFHWTEDGGQTWENRTTSGILLHGVDLLYELDMIDELNGWVVGRYQEVYRTSDGGFSWTKVILPIGESQVFRHVRFANQNEGWITANFGTVMHTSDGGATWQDKSIPGFLENIQDVHVEGDTLFVIGGYSGGLGGLGWLRKSNDGGNTWPFVYNNVRGIQNSIHKQGERIWTAGFAGFIYHFGIPPEIAPVVNFDVIEGAVVGGGLADLIIADNSYLVFKSPSSRVQVNAIFARSVISFDAMTTVSNPTLINLQVESSLTVPNGVEVISLLNWNTGQFDVVSITSISSVDQQTSVAVLAPEFYTGPNGEIKILIEHRVTRRNRLLFFRSKIDQLRILVD